MCIHGLAGRAGVLALLVSATCLVGCARIDTVTPDPAIAGATVRVTGAGFGAAPGGAVLYDGSPTTIVSWTDTVIEFSVPPSSAIGSHELRVRPLVGAEVTVSHSVESACPNGTAPVHAVWDRLSAKSMRPLPSDEFAEAAPTATGMRVALATSPLVPADDLLARHEAALVTEVSTLDGWGTSAAALVDVSAPLDFAAMGGEPLHSASVESRQRWVLDGPAAPIFFMDVDPASAGHRGARTGVIVDPLGDGALEIEPIVPLAPGRRQALVITRAALGAADTSGSGLRCVEPSATWTRVVAGTAPLADPTERSLRSFFTDRLSEVWAADPGHALALGDVALALPFTTQTTVSEMQAVQHQIEAAPPPVLVPGSLTIDEPTSGAVARVLHGRFTSPDFRGTDRVWQASSTGPGFVQDPSRDHDFLLVVPRGSTEHPGPFPLVIFLHSIGSSLEEANAHAGQLAALGVATLAINAEEHEVGDPDGSILRFLNLIDVVFRAPTALRVVRDNFRQSTVDQLSALRFVGTLGLPELDRSAPVVVVGSSLGGVMGVALGSLSHDVGAASLYTAGGQLTRLVFESAVFQSLVPIFDFWLGLGEPVTQADRKGFFQLVQTVLDAADPVSFAPHLVGAPLDERGPRGVLQLESVPDATICNRSNEALARALGLTQVAPMVAPITGLVASLAPLADNVGPGITAGFFQYDEYHQRTGGPLVPATHDSLPTALEPQAQTQAFVRGFFDGAPTIVDPFAIATR